MNLSSVNLNFFANVAPLVGGLNKAQRAMDGAGKKMQAVGKQMTKSITAPMAALGAVAIHTFQGFELEMSKVRAVSGATADEFSRLESSAKKLGASTVFSAKEVASLQVEFAKLGFTASEIDKVTESTLYLAQAADTDLARAAEVAGSTLRAFGLDASETGRVTDVMAKSFSTSALDMEKFADSMKYVAPVANSAGMSLEETSAMLAVMANAGIKGSQAGTSLRRIISELGSGSEPVTDKIKKLADAGIGLADAKDEVGRSAQSALLVLAKGVDSIDPLTQSFNDAKGSAKAMADIMGDTVYGSMKSMQSATEGAMIQVGEIISTGFRPLVDFLTKVIQGFNNLNPGIKKFAIGMGIGLAVIGPMVLGIGSVTRAYAAFKTVLLATNPLLLAFTVAAGVIGGLLFMQSSALDDNTKSLIRNQSEANVLLETIKRENISQDTRNSLIDKFNAKFGQYAGNLSKEKSTIEEIAKAQEELNAQFKQKIKLAGVEKVLNERLEDAAELSAEILVLEEQRTDKLDRLRRLEAAGGDTAQDEINLRNSIESTAESIANKTRKLETLTTKTAELQEKMDSLLPSVENVTGVVDDLGEQPNGVTALGDEADKTKKKFRTLNEEVERLASLEAQFTAAMLGEVTDEFRGMIQPLDAAAMGLEEFTDMDFEDAPVFETLPKGFAKIKIAAMELSAAVNVAMQRMAADTIIGLSEMAGAMMVGQASFADFGSFLIGQFANLFAEIGKMFIDYGLAQAAFQMANITMNPALAIAAGASLLAIAGAIKGKMKSAGTPGGIPAMAEGGIVTAPTLALIGEGRGPEAVIPLDKLQGMMSGGAQNINVTGRIQGQDILLSQERASRIRSRYRGF